MDEFSAAIDELARDHERQLRLVKQAYGELKELTATSGSDDGMVTVEVGPRGQVRRLELDPRVYRKLSPTELSDAIMEQIGRATASVTERSTELMAPLVPDGLPYEELFGEDVNPDTLLP